MLLDADHTGMAMQLEFGRNLGYLLTAYGIVLLAIGGYTATLFARWRALSRRDSPQRRP